MRSITIRQLDQNLFKELEDLPVEVTRYGIPYCVINAVASIPSVWVTDDSTGPIPKVVSTLPKVKSELSSKKDGMCPHFVALTGYCRKCSERKSSEGR